MKKLVIVALSAVLALMAVEPAQAQDQKVLAIIDTAVDSAKIPSVIYEACFTVNRSCPNGLAFMEGVGSANSKVWPANIGNATYHGHNMTQAALAINPNIKIVFVRIADITAQGNSGNQPQSLALAIDWVSKNASKYSIDAVSISQSGVKKTLSGVVLGQHYACSDSSIFNPFVNQISQLNVKNIPTFIATGNDRASFVGFPACVTGVIGVGALANQTQLEKATNVGPGLTMVALTGVKIPKYNRPIQTADSVYGSSVATAIASASYVNNNKYNTFGEYLNALPKIIINKVTYIRN